MSSSNTNHFRLQSWTSNIYTHKENISGVLSEVDISDINDLESTTVEATESTAYCDSSTTEPEDSLPVEK